MTGEADAAAHVQRRDLALKGFEAGALIAVFVAVTTKIAGDIGYMLLNPRIRFQ